MREIIYVGLSMFAAFTGASQLAAGVKAPPSLVFIACQVEDWTGRRPLPPGVMPTKDWRDLELHIEGGEYICKRIAIENIQDASIYHEKATADMMPREPNMGHHGQCARVGVPMSHNWDMDNKGWSVVGVGCPTPMDLNGDGIVDSWKLPECPTYLPGTTNRMKCRFDESNV